MPLTLFESDDRIVQTQVISDGFGNRIELPKWGCCSWAEKIAIEKEMGGEITATEQQANIAGAFLKLRLKEKLTEPFNEDELLCDRNGQALPEPMIENLYKFAMAEYNRDKPNSQMLTIIGEEGKETAIAYAMGHQATVITRSDLTLQNVFYVFSDGEILESLNEGRPNLYYIVEDFSTPSSSKKVGKSKKTTGTSSTSSSDITSPE
jgi:hypothetical protein